MKLSLSKKILIGRVLTRSGDQAWDFTLPLVLLIIFPNQLRIAALFYLIVRLSNTILLPRISMLIDQWNRSNAVKLGIFLQSIGVLLCTVSIYLFSTHNVMGQPPQNLWLWIVGTFFVIGGCLGSLGSSFLDITIANDLVPSAISKDEITVFNSHLRQVDLLTEVMSPILAVRLPQKFRPLVT